ncbi:MAG: class I SAM-dependent methyltransferase [Bdellovibrionales bacterium]|nr:class I SAM-dependent methyltransferase [Bdellovibrionales bacterium]
MTDHNSYSIYHRYARFYNLCFGIFTNQGHLKAISQANLKEGEKVLEVGVGTGLSLPHYPTNVEVTGIDLSPQMLERAKNLVKKESLHHVKDLQIMNAEKMTFADNTFDCVMAMHVSTVVGSPKNFADEMRRVCKPNGRILIVNYFHDSKTPLGKLSQFLVPYAKYIGFRPDLTLENFLEQTNFIIEKQFPVNLFNVHSVFLVRNNKTAK